MREVPSRRRRASAPLRHLGRNCCHDGYSDDILRRLDINDIALDQAAPNNPAHSIDEEAQTERGTRDVSANLAVGWNRCDSATDPRKGSRSCKTTEEVARSERVKSSYELRCSRIFAPCDSKSGVGDAIRDVAMRPAQNSSKSRQERAKRSKPAFSESNSPDMEIKVFERGNRRVVWILK